MTILTTVAFSLLGIDAAIRIYGHISIVLSKRGIERAIQRHYREAGKHLDGN